jgi:hypothetical protein
MIKKLSFDFKDLHMDRSIFNAALGFPGDLPEPFNDYLDEAWQFSEKLNDIRAIYKLFDEIDWRDKHPVLTVSGINFNIGKIIKREIRDSERVAFFICTAGETICSHTNSLMKGGNQVLGCIFDLMGTFIAEAAGDSLQEHLKKDVLLQGDKITNRYSPGYCQWPTEDQNQLFGLFHENTCGVSLTPSCLMQPVKSISGLIGIGGKVYYRKYNCDLCQTKNCIYRRLKKM